MMQVKQISDNEIYLLIKYIKSVLWRVAKRLSYIEEARCLKFNTRNSKSPIKIISNIIKFIVTYDLLPCFKYAFFVFCFSFVFCCILSHVLCYCTIVIVSYVLVYLYCFSYWPLSCSPSTLVNKNSDVLLLRPVSSKSNHGKLMFLNTL